MGERGEIAGSADGAGFGDDRDDAAVWSVQEADEGFDDDRADAGMAAGERADQREHHGADDVRLKRRADAGGVGADEVALEGFEIVGRDALAGEGTEAGIDAVVRLAVGEDFLEGARGSWRIAARAAGAEPDGSVMAGETSLQVGEGDGMVGDEDGAGAVGWAGLGHRVECWRVRGAGLG